MEALDSIYWIYVKLKLDCYWVIIYLQCLSIGKWNKKARFTAVGLGKFRVITLLKYNSCLSSVVFLLCAVSHIECLSAIFVYTDNSKFMLAACFAGLYQICQIDSGTLLMILINTDLPCWLDASIKWSIDSKHNALSTACGGGHAGSLGLKMFWYMYFRCHPCLECRFPLFIPFWLHDLRTSALLFEQKQISLFVCKFPSCSSFSPQAVLLIKWTNTILLDPTHLNAWEI